MGCLWCWGVGPGVTLCVCVLGCSLVTTGPLVSGAVPPALTHTPLNYRARKQTQVSRDGGNVSPILP